MPGQPITRAFLREVEARGGWEPILLAIAEGRTITSLAREYGVSRGLMSTVLHKDPERSRLVREAQLVAADMAAEDAVEIAEQTTPATERADRLRVDVKRWVASVLHKDKYGAQQTPLVQINAGSLHIAALQRVEAAYDERTGGGQLPAPPDRAPEAGPPAAPAGGGRGGH